MEPAHAPLRHAALGPPKLRDSLHRLTKEQSHRPPGLLFEHPREDGKWGHEGNYTHEVILRRRRVLLAEFAARMEYTRLPECVMMFGEPMGVVGCVEGRKNSGWGVSSITSEFRHRSRGTNGRLQPRTRENDARQRYKRDGTYHGELIAAEKVRAELRHAAAVVVYIRT